MFALFKNALLCLLRPHRHIFAKVAHIRKCGTQHAFLCGHDGLYEFATER